LGKFQPDSYKTERLVCVETDGQTDMASAVLLFFGGMWHAVPLLRCGPSSPAPKFKAEAKVRCVQLFPFAHGTSALPSKFSLSHSPNSLSPNALSRTFRSPNALFTTSPPPNSHSPTFLSPNSHRLAVTAC